MPPRRQPPLLPLTQGSAPHSSTPSPADSPPHSPPPPPPPPPPPHSPPPGSSNISSHLCHSKHTYEAKAGVNHHQPSTVTRDNSITTTSGYNRKRKSRPDSRRKWFIVIVSPYSSRNDVAFPVTACCCNTTEVSF
ncbi:hypothetical protein E3N88_10380 [Mikania micrantha]|uniref:Uncharacterized protein n=1 Tax=Mikania micrantha TaxID=192012 RepID=A0A5N6PBL5_9ASTR|nr:hypothetical protein E3N88_10380 [Mikania micrantha]